MTNLNRNQNSGYNKLLSHNTKNTKNTIEYDNCYLKL